jgi:tRNA(Arg) A34 adenosine deaminase TadA
MTVDDKHFMLLALKEARKNLALGHGGPFGACIVKKGNVVAVARNTVLKEKNPVCHAEINAIRKACRKLKTHCLGDCIIYSTAEPCPMCFSAIHWAGIKKIVFGASIADAKKAGFNEMAISNRAMNFAGKARIKIVSGVEAKKCRALLEEWAKKGKPVY